MKIPQEKHIAFYEQQIKAQEDKWREYADCSMNILIKEKRLFIGRIWGVQESHGNVVLRFNEGEVPRMKQPYFLGLVGSGAPGNPLTWKFSYKTFRSSMPPQPRYFSGVKADIYTITYWKTEEGKSYILVSGFDIEVLSNIKEKYLDRKIHPLIVVAETDPPVEYLINLKDFVSKNENNAILNLELNVSEANWKPVNLNNEKNVTNDVIQFIEKQKITLIQGPPGTGKSYLAAELCGYYLKQGKSICVTALTNKALMEIASKDGLVDSLKIGKVYKTNLTGDELKDIPKLKKVESFSPEYGDLLLSTYYKLTQKQSEIIEGSKRFDLLIIEEASQAYLATIAMFSSIAEKVLIIGDHKQLTPVVIKIEEAKTLFKKIEGVIYGLQTFAINHNEVSYRLTKTRRLTSSASELTGLFYDDSLESISDREGNTGFSSNYRNLFHENGGISIAKLSTARIGFTEKDVLSFICKISREICENNPKIGIVLLTPYINVESELYTQYSKLSSDYKCITINTIHKIQGLTTDLTILYLPLTNAAFDLNDNLFNVGTSRSTRGTLIITYEHIDLASSVSIETKTFINECKNVSKIFITRFKEGT
jgi:energy-coupling factor transporter ATP-binding protein EcfA2